MIIEKESVITGCGRFAGRRYCDINPCIRVILECGDLLLFLILEEAHVAQSEPGFDLFRHLFGNLLVLADLLCLTLSLVINKNPPDTRSRRFLSYFDSHESPSPSPCWLSLRQPGRVPDFR